jgi:cell division protein FtsB
MTRYSLRDQLIQEHKRRNRVFFVVSVIISGFILYSFLFSDMGYLKYRQLKNNEKKLSEEIREIKEQNKTLKYEIELLKKDPVYSEKYARENFGLVKPGEMIFQFEPENKENK